jgi:hypothetical protein
MDLKCGRQRSVDVRSFGGTTVKLSVEETLKLLSDIEEALQWWEIKGPQDRDWRGIAISVQEALAHSEFCTIDNPFGSKRAPY